ncbi:MAG: type II toxin-antitoxin system HicA family toxin [Phycisphaerales bacterium JB063]
MPPLPIISGRDLVRALESIGYVVIRQRGSHLRLRHPNNDHRKPTTVPLHKTLKRGTLNSILKDAGLSVDECIDLLK